MKLPLIGSASLASAFYSALARHSSYSVMPRTMMPDGSREVIGVGATRLHR